MDSRPIGLTIEKGWLLVDDAIRMYDHINSVEFMWDKTPLKRFTSQFGYSYGFTTRTVTKLDRPIDTDPVISEVAHLLPKTESVPPHQCLVNRYVYNEKIAAHIDCIPCFGEKIFTVSLGSSATMRFTRDSQEFDVRLEQGDLVIMEGESRYLWRHQILPLEEGVRYSLTYRHVLPKYL